jgi:hypothetical protein
VVVIEKSFFRNPDAVSSRHKLFDVRVGYVKKFVRPAGRTGVPELFVHSETFSLL